MKLDQLHLHIDAIGKVVGYFYDNPILEYSPTYVEFRSAVETAFITHQGLVANKNKPEYITETHVLDRKGTLVPWAQVMHEFELSVPVHGSSYRAKIPTTHQLNAWGAIEMIEKAIEPSSSRIHKLQKEQSDMPEWMQITEKANIAKELRISKLKESNPALYKQMKEAQ